MLLNGVQSPSDSTRSRYWQRGTSRPNQQDVANAWVLYWVNVEFTKLIERFRIGITGENKLTYEEFNACSRTWSRSCEMLVQVTGLLACRVCRVWFSTRWSV